VLTSPLTPDAMASDGLAYIDFLDAERSVRPGSMGVVGFCFAGQFALRVAGGKAFNAESAERGFARLMELMDGTLRSPVSA